MGYPRWKLIEHRKSDSLTVHIGLFDRCEDVFFKNGNLYNKTYPICDSNKYLPPSSPLTTRLCTIEYNDAHCQKLCNRLDKTLPACDYLSFTKGLIACTIVAACTIGLALIMTYSNLLINPFKYKTHIIVSSISLFLLFIGFAALLTTLIILGSYMQRDLFEYLYNLSNQLQRGNLNATQKANLERLIRSTATNDYDVRLNWSSGLEIVSLIMTTFSLITQ
ncbi:unnamed protein product, partial [Didymodactylos carnosus]